MATRKKATRKSVKAGEPCLPHHVWRTRAFEGKVCMKCGITARENFVANMRKVGEAAKRRSADAAKAAAKASSDDSA